MMNKNNLKQVLRPLIKECIKEVIFEEGFLSGIVSEVLIGVQGANTVSLVESSTPSANAQQKLLARKEQERSHADADRERRRKIMETKHQVSRAVNKSKKSYNGVDLFEGTEPLSKAGAPGRASAAAPGPLSGVDPSDAGVDISSFFGSPTSWSK
tara:strand:+ start:387 stop:851 length:465 start_codon:yes stop_codon:yes gene_type:complete